MGANTSKNNGHVNHTQRRVDEQVDFGSTLPNGLYPSAEKDFDLRSVRRLIVQRKLAPFYKGQHDPPQSVECSPMSSTLQSGHCTDRSCHESNMEPAKRKQQLFSEAVECPICFLYYPANMNFSRCCDQPICTECFVQIKRSAETPLVPATCPFCVQDNFGVVYQQPEWGDTVDHHRGARHTTSGLSDSVKKRKSISHNSPNVVLVDHVRPDWQIKASNIIRSRANSSGPHIRAHPTFGRTGRSASLVAANDYNEYLSTMRGVNMDLEEWMVIEAIRQSLVEQEERERLDDLQPSPPPVGDDAFLYSDGENRPGVSAISIDSTEYGTYTSSPAVETPPSSTSSFAPAQFLEQNTTDSVDGGDHQRSRRASASISC
ncbi:SNF1-interacting protein [Apophysomyces sp. BC1034]|nr:SNF1-interacting protein [Apophysomyces sp. BC1015]KAG0175808.1 SNF1-interacting protein [Apophysomyces sp. BC1021]KAG0186143.1 SNF1-interacting protein [Apophysomyces sp. BC1034]